jgi:AGZA family xanthine/uracil permease-like MFS transporter
MATTKKPAAKPAASKSVAAAKKPVAATATKKPGVLGALDRYFKVSDRGSTFGTEIRGGLTTFVTMAYIVALNPIIIGYVAASDGTYVGGGTEPNLPLIAAATALVAGVLTILMGVWARFPIALAAGLGLNAFVAYGLVVHAGLSWKAAMGLVVVEGLVILVLVLTGFRVAVFKAVPSFLKKAIAVGIGLFIAFIGLWDAKIIRDPGAAFDPTPTELGGQGSLNTWPALVFVIALFLGILLLVLRVKGALLLSMIGASAVAFLIEALSDKGLGMFDAAINPGGWALGQPNVPDSIAATPDFSLLGKFDFTGFEQVGILVACLFVFSLLLADFFDTMGTMTAIGAEAGLNDKDGNPPNAKEILIVDSIAAIAGGASSTSSHTSYIESASGVGDGARTGLSSVVVGICFLLATFLSPVVTMIPAEAAGAILVIVGFLMVAQVADIDWRDHEIAIPAFLTIILMPFSFSIAVGIGAGFVAYTFIQVAKGKARGIHLLMWITTAAFVAYFMRSIILGWAS